MKKLKRVALLLAVCLCLLSGGILQASAATLDGLEVTVTTDEKKYKPADDIVATVLVTNRNTEPVTNLSLKSLIPEGYELADGAVEYKTIGSLKPGESVSLTVTLDSLTQKNPVSVLVYVLAGVVVLGVGGGVVAFVLVYHKKRLKSTIAAVLCLALIGGMATPAFAEAPRTEQTIAHTVKAGGKDVLLQMLLSYDNVEAANDFLGLGIEKMLYDVGTKVYHNVEEMPVFSGTLAAVDQVKAMKCIVTDAQNNQLLEKEIVPSNFWSVSGFALMVGMNHIRISVELKNGFVYEKNLVVNNVCAANMAMLNVDKGDDDGDGVLNFIEKLHGTDPQKADTDGDGLSDYDEIATLGTDAKLTDTDNNNVSDAAEDADKDNLTNGDEINVHKTDPTTIDTDGDGLSDQAEVVEHKTDPTLADTDKDGADDGWELKNGYDPVVENKDLPKEEEAPVPDNVAVESEGEVTVTLLPDHELINENTPGYMGQDPIHVEIEEGHSANITMEYDQAYLEEGDTPELYYLDEKTQCYEKVESTVNAEGKVEASVEKTGVYVLLNHRLVDDVWENDIFRPSELVQDGPIDVVFVTDRSQSMDSNDPKGIRKEVIKEFVNKLRDGVDRAAVIQFTSVAELLVPLSHDKELICTAVDGIVNSDGGGCAGSDENAGTNGSAGIRAALTELSTSQAQYKYIVFLTDGDDTTVSEDYGDEAGTSGLTGDAKKAGIVIHTVGLVGSGGVDIDLLKRVAKGTGGNYYLASVGEDAETNSELVQIYEEIESVTINRHLDTNADGISDYYTKLICDGKLTTGTGMGDLFGGATYDDVQKNADLDGDGVRNGDELVVQETEKGVFVKVVSYPYAADSDKDTLGDPKEIGSSFSPLKKNGVVAVADVDWLTNSENFWSDDYLDLYNGSALERGSVLLGNVFFGTTLDQTNLYRQMLAEYFADIDKNLMSSASEATYEAYADAFFDATFQQIEDGLVAVSNEPNKLENELQKFQKFAKDVMGNVKLFGDPAEQLTGDKEALEKAVTNLVNLKNKWDLKECQKQMDIIKEHMSHVARGATDATRAGQIAKLNEFSGELAKYDADSDVLKGKIEINSAKVNKIFKGLDVLDKVTTVIDLTQKVWGAHSNYCDTVAALGTMEKNVYILDNILATTTNPYLRGAANALRFYIDDSVDADSRKLAMAVDEAAGVVTDVVLDKVHEKIATMGYVGIAIELIRAFGNVVFDLDDMSKCAAETVALAASGEGLGKNYLAHLEGGYAQKHDGQWISYADYADQMYVSILNLALLRKKSENKMAEWQKHEEVKSGCASNVEKCETMINRYNTNYFNVFLQ